MQTNTAEPSDHAPPWRPGPTTETSSQVLHYWGLVQNQARTKTATSPVPGEPQDENHAQTKPELKRKPIQNQREKWAKTKTRTRLEPRPKRKTIPTRSRCRTMFLLSYNLHAIAHCCATASSCMTLKRLLLLSAPTISSIAALVFNSTTKFGMN